MISIDYHKLKKEIETDKRFRFSFFATFVK